MENSTNITPEEAKGILILINRTQLSGAEAEGVVMIKQKLFKIAQPVLEAEAKEAKKEDKK